MTEYLPSLQPATAAPPERVFVEDERHLLTCAVRHLAAAKALIDAEPVLIPDADFLVMMAAECVFKHMYCLVRFQKGFAGPRKQTDFGSVRLASEFVHDVKQIGSVLVGATDDLKGYLPLQELMVEIRGAVDWNRDRYKAKEITDNWRANVIRKISLVERIVRDVSPGASDAF